MRLCMLTVVTVMSTMLVFLDKLVLLIANVEVLQSSLRLAAYSILFE
ncbi:hypothetical protein HBA_0138 [Sodalis endosymbiont of Henestaris halophilus]|nr:hypothetical protein HBA_0138 [Sodalis endosymbiont of Henestaris halophilus]